MTGGGGFVTAAPGSTSVFKLYSLHLRFNVLVAVIPYLWIDEKIKKQHILMTILWIVGLMVRY